jgi:hypothetical protein
MSAHLGPADIEAIKQSDAVINEILTKAKYKNRKTISSL